MPGTILSAVTRKRIADSMIHSARIATSRQQLLNIYESSRLTLVKGPLFDRVCDELADRARFLGVYKERTN